MFRAEEGEDRGVSCVLLVHREALGREGERVRVVEFRGDFCIFQEFFVVVFFIFLSILGV